MRDQLIDKNSSFTHKLDASFTHDDCSIVNCLDKLLWVLRHRHYPNLQTRPCCHKQENCTDCLHYTNGYLVALSCRPNCIATHALTPFLIILLLIAVAGHVLLVSSLPCTSLCSRPNPLSLSVHLIPRPARLCRSLPDIYSSCPLSLGSCLYTFFLFRPPLSPPLFTRSPPFLSAACSNTPCPLLVLSHDTVFGRKDTFSSRVIPASGICRVTVLTLGESAMNFFVLTTSYQKMGPYDPVQGEKN